MQPPPPPPRPPCYSVAVEEVSHTFKHWPARHGRILATAQNVFTLFLYELAQNVVHQTKPQQNLPHSPR